MLRFTCSSFYICKVAKELPTIESTVPCRFRLSKKESMSKEWHHPHVVLNWWHPKGALKLTRVAELQTVLVSFFTPIPPRPQAMSTLRFPPPQLVFEPTVFPFIHATEHCGKESPRRGFFGFTSLLQNNNLSQ